MSLHYTFTAQFREWYDKATERFAAGVRSSAQLFSAAELAALRANGLNPQAFLDYVEDQQNYGEPGYDNALSIELIRRDYFLNVQKGVASSRVLDETAMPAKTDSVKGVEWLPRLLPKARAKLAGELPDSLMYGCGGDRRFFRTHDILPAEFLSLIWRSQGNDAPVIEWVLERRKATGLPTT